MQTQSQSPAPAVPGPPQAPLIDEKGEPLPDWKRKVLQKRLDEEWQKQQLILAEERAKEARWDGVPAWRRAMLEKKEREASAPSPVAVQIVDVPVPPPPAIPLLAAVKKPNLPSSLIPPPPAPVIPMSAVAAPPPPPILVPPPPPTAFALAVTSGALALAPTGNVAPRNPDAAAPANARATFVQPLPPPPPPVSTTSMHPMLAQARAVSSVSVPGARAGLVLSQAPNLVRGLCIVVCGLFMLVFCMRLGGLSVVCLFKYKYIYLRAPFAILCPTLTILSIPSVPLHLRPYHHRPLNRRSLPPHQLPLPLLLTGKQS